MTPTSVGAVIFDMDGVLIDSEPVWNRVRQKLAAEHGRIWDDDLQRACMGRSTVEWAEVMRTGIPLRMTVPEVIEVVVARMVEEYERQLPLLPGAVEAVRRMAAAFPVALASGSMTTLIHHVLRASGLEQVIPVVVLGDTIPRGKPAPDIYLEAARRLGAAPEHCAGIEDSANGLRALRAAGMKAVAVPSPEYPLAEDVLALAHLRLRTLDELTVDAVKALG